MRNRWRGWFMELSASRRCSVLSARCSVAFGPINRGDVFGAGIRRKMARCWSWFGVNMLGIGLHSYGFTDAAFQWLMIFVASQVAIIILGLTPLNKWRS